MSNPQAAIGRERQVALAKILLEVLEGERPEAPDVAARVLVYIFEALSRLNGRPARHFALETLAFGRDRGLLEKGFEAVGNSVSDFGEWRLQHTDRDVYFGRPRQRALAECLVSALKVSGVGEEAARRIALRFRFAFEQFNFFKAEAFVSRLCDLLAEADFSAPPRDLDAA